MVDNQYKRATLGSMVSKIALAGLLLASPTQAASEVIYFTSNDLKEAYGQITPPKNKLGLDKDGIELVIVDGSVDPRQNFAVDDKPDIAGVVGHDGLEETHFGPSTETKLGDKYRAWRDAFVKKQIDAFRSALSDPNANTSMVYRPEDENSYGVIHPAGTTRTASVDGGLQYFVHHNEGKVTKFTVQQHDDYIVNIDGPITDSLQEVLNELITISADGLFE